MIKVLVLGGSAEQIPMISLVRALGLKAIVVDLNPHCAGRPLAHEFVLANIANTAEILRQLDGIRPDAVTSMITEAGIPAIFELCKNFDLPCSYSPESVDATCDKYAMRQILASKKLNNVSFCLANDVQKTKELGAECNYNLVLKRRDTGGQRDIFRVKSKADLNRFEQKISSLQKKQYICEEFIPGPEVNVVFTVAHGQVRDLIISDRLTSGVFGIVDRHVYPSRFPSKIKNEIHRFCENIAKTLKIEQGVVFPQFIISSGNIPHLLELGVRIPGGAMEKLFHYATGIDLVHFVLDASLGRLQEYETYRNSDPNDLIQVTFFNGPPGALLSGSIREILTQDNGSISKSVLEHGLFNQSINACRIRELKNGGDRFYYCVTTGDSQRDAHEAAKSLFKNTDFFSLEGKNLKNPTFDFEEYYGF